MEKHQPRSLEIPEHMIPLLEHFEPKLVEHISSLFESPNDYEEAMRGWRSRALHNGEYDPRIDALLELRSED